MRNLIAILIFIFPFFGISQINYGSNHGKYLTIRGTKVYYEEYGKGTPLLLLHGGLGNIADFKKCIPGLSNKFRVIIPDAPGLGRSEFPDSALTYQLLAKYYSKLIDLLKLDSLYVLGWSDGGNTGLLLANYRPDKVKKLVVSGANYKSNGMQKGLVEEAQATIMNPEFVEMNMKEWIEDYKRLSPQDDWKRYLEESKKMWFADEYFSKSILEDIKASVLVVLGDRDVVTLEHGIEMKDLIKQSQFCVLPNTSHEVFKEKPALINQIAINFFNGK